MYSLVIFDLDDTLAESKSALQPDMVDTFGRLLSRTKVAIISGGKYEQFLKQVISQLPSDTHFENLFIFPTCGAAYYRFQDNAWQQVYQERLSDDDVVRIFTALQEGQKESGVITE